VPDLVGPDPKSPPNRPLDNKLLENPHPGGPNRQIQPTADPPVHVPEPTVPIINMMNQLIHPEPQWLETARRLREVRYACLQFLDRWAIGHLLSDASALDRVAGDVQTQTDAAIADHANRDWTILYRGSVLDD